MRSAPLTLLLFLLTGVLLPASALAVDGDGEVTFAIAFKSDHGLSVKLEADDDEIELVVQKPGQQAAYFTSGEVTREGITAKFGSFGEFDVDYEPTRTLESHGPNRHCEGEPKTTTEGFFHGTMRFRGENGYVRVEAARAKGTLVLQPRWECDYRRAGASQAARERKADDEATLVATARHEKLQFVVFGSREEGERPYNYFFAASQEVKERVSIARLTFSGTRSSGFEFDNRRGTATVDPPAPFSGSAHYLRRPHAPDRWRGSLSAPLLGLGRVRLTGPRFVAHLVPELPELE